MTRPNSPEMDALIGMSYPVLDHGFVRVVDYMGNDSAVVQAARVSYGEGTKTALKDRGLIRYLMRHGHTSPFEMCEIKIHVKLPIFVARQWIRHRTASVNEVSARYSTLPAEYYTPEAGDICYQSQDNKQGRGDPVTDLTSTAARMAFTSANGDSRFYHGALESMSISRELARIVQPVSQYTEWYWKTDLHNLFHFLALRMHPHAQLEIRRYAEVISEIVKAWVPLSWEAFHDYRLTASKLSGPQVTALWQIARRAADGSKQLTRKETTLSRREWDQLRAIVGPLLG